jgi:hypothetical protein
MAVFDEYKSFLSKFIPYLGRTRGILSSGAGDGGVFPITSLSVNGYESIGI